MPGPGIGFAIAAAVAAAAAARDEWTRDPKAFARNQFDYILKALIGRYLASEQAMAAAGGPSTPSGADASSAADRYMEKLKDFRDMNADDWLDPPPPDDPPIETPEMKARWVFDYLGWREKFLACTAGLADRMMDFDWSKLAPGLEPPPGLVPEPEEPTRPWKDEPGTKIVDPHIGGLRLALVMAAQMAPAGTPLTTALAQPGAPQLGFGALGGWVLSARASSSSAGRMSGSDSQVEPRVLDSLGARRNGRSVNALRSPMRRE
jgi:hypothetical protein